MASEIDLAAAEKELAEANEQLSKPADAEGTRDTLIRYRKAQARVEAARQTR